MTTLLRADGLRLEVAGRVLCQALSVAVEPGQCWAILGANGAGKSTLLNVLAGLLPATAGALYWQEQPLAALPRQARARQIGLLLQQEHLEYAGTVLDYVLLGRYPWRQGFGIQAAERQAAQDALAQMQLAALAGRRLGQLSGGELQRARIAQLLVQQPQLYCLDEPLLHLDLAHQGLLMRHLHGLAQTPGRAVVMVLHDIYWAQRYCDHALLLYPDGRAQAGRSADLLQQEPLEALYQCRLRAFNDGEGQFFAAD